MTMTHPLGTPPTSAPPVPTRPAPVPAERGWDRVQVVEALRVAAVRQREAETDQYALIAAAADVYSWVDNSAEIVDQLADDDSSGGRGGGPMRVLHGERLWQFGADGTPEVAEFLTFEIGPALGISPESAAVLIADVLDLRHRLPRTWQHLLDGQVRGWLARKIAQTTRQAALPLATARELDRHLGPFLPGWTPTQALRRVAMLIERLDPDAAEQRRRDALARRYVTIGRAESGTAFVHGQLDGPAGLALNETVDDLADMLGAGGLDGGRDMLRAEALSLLADPARAADLLNGTLLHLDTADPTDPGPDVSAAAGVRVDLSRAGATTVRGRGGRSGASSDANEALRSPWRVGTLTLDLHVTAADLAAGAGGDCRQLGELVRSQIHDLITRADRFIIRPVLDPHTPSGAGSYQIPDAIKEIVKLRNPTTVFPYSNRSSTGRGIDIDHVIPWPAGPTHTDNLAPTDRRAHRAKTFGGYTMTTIRPGVYQWRTPTGQQYWVTPHGTHTTHPNQTPPARPTTLADRARDALRRAHPDPNRPGRVRDRLPRTSLQPVLLPDPEPPVAWNGRTRLPDPDPTSPWEVRGAPPF